MADVESSSVAHVNATKWFCAAQNEEHL